MPCIVEWERSQLCRRGCRSTASSNSYTLVPLIHNKAYIEVHAIMRHTHINRTEHIDDSVQLINLLLFSQHCFLSQLKPQYPQLTMLFHSTTIFTLAHLLPLSLARLPQQKKTPYKLSSITKALLTHTLASFWRKQSCSTGVDSYSHQILFLHSVSTL